MAKTNTPRWLTLADKIADSWAKQSRSQRNNRKDMQVLNGILNTLMDGSTLSPAQRQAFLTSIRKRVPFQGDFHWMGEIALTPRQVRYAKTSGQIEAIRSKMNTENSEAKGDNLSTFVPDLSPLCPQFVTTLSPLCHQNGSKALATSTSRPLTIRNDTIRNITEDGLSPIEGDWDSPSDDEAHAPHQTCAALAVATPQHMSSPTPLSTGDDCHASRGKVESYGWEPERAEPAEVATPGTIKASADIWENQHGVKGYLVVNGVRFRIRLDHVDKGLGIIAKAGDTEANALWRNTVLYPATDHLVTFSRHLPVGHANVAINHAVSGLYPEELVEPHSTPYPQLAVVARWEGNLLQELVLIADNENIAIPMKPYVGNNDRAPQYKGAKTKKESTR